MEQLTGVVVGGIVAALGAAFVTYSSFRRERSDRRVERRHEIYAGFLASAANRANYSSKLGEQCVYRGVADWRDDAVAEFRRASDAAQEKWMDHLFIAKVVASGDMRRRVDEIAAHVERRYAAVWEHAPQRYDNALWHAEWEILRDKFIDALQQERLRDYGPWRARLTRSASSTAAPGTQ